jgi:hypothetical protein
VFGACSLLECLLNGGVHWGESEMSYGKRLLSSPLQGTAARTLPSKRGTLGGLSFEARFRSRKKVLLEGNVSRKLLASRSSSTNMVSNGNG